MTYYVKVKAFSDDPGAGDVPYRDVATVEGYDEATAIVDGIAEPISTEDFIMATQHFLEAYRSDATIKECEQAMAEAGYRIVKVKQNGRTG